MTNEQKQQEVGSDVFVSYKREDRDRVEPIVSALRDLDLSVWLDAALEAGETFDEEISRELSGARSHLVCWTKASVSSRWVRAEAHIGAGRNILVPIFLEPCTPFPPFNLDHTVSLADWGGQLDHAEWRRVLTRIGGLLGRGSALSRWNNVATTKDVSELRSFIRDFPTDVLAAKARHFAFQKQLGAARVSLLKELGFSEAEAEASAVPAVEVQLKDLTQALNRERLQHADEMSKLKSRLFQADEEAAEVRASLATAQARLVQCQETVQSQLESARTGHVQLEEESAKKSSLETELTSATTTLFKLEATVSHLQSELAASRALQNRTQVPEKTQSKEYSIPRPKGISSAERAAVPKVTAPVPQEPKTTSTNSRSAILTVVLVFIALILYLGRDLFWKA